MPVGENAESRARDAINAQDPKAGQEMQQVQALQSSIQEIQGERTNNLQAARMGAEGDARENAAMLQAAELGMLGGAAGGMGATIENVTPVQQTSPTTQALLSKYGVGKPKNQRVSTRNVQVTPQKITINNNTTNNTTNNVAIPPANVGGPVQGRTLAIKQQPDQGQARFKTWISNAFARQNQAAQQREKEYQRREWSLSRTTGKLMKKLQELGTTISERMDPRKMASSVGGHIKTLLFLFGTTFLAANWKRVIRIGANIERFFFGEPDPKNPDGKRGEPGFKTLIKDIFGAKEGETVGEAIRKFFWNPADKEGKGSGVLNLLFDAVKTWFQNGANAVKAIPFPDISAWKIGDSIKALANYLGNVFTVMMSGGSEGLKKVFDKETAKATKGSVANRDEDVMATTQQAYVDGKTVDVISGDRGIIMAATANKDTLAADGAYIAQSFKEGGNAGIGGAKISAQDLDKKGNLVNDAGASIRQSRALYALNQDNKGFHSAEILASLGRLEKVSKENKDNGGTPVDISFLQSYLTPAEIEQLKKDGKLQKVRYASSIVNRSTDEENARALLDMQEAFGSAAQTYAAGHVKNFLGRKTGAKLLGAGVGTIIGYGAGMLLCMLPGGAALGIPIMMGSTLAGGMVGAKIADVLTTPEFEALINWKKADGKAEKIKNIKKRYKLKEISEEEYNKKYKDGKAWDSRAATYYKATPEVFEKIRRKLGINSFDYTDTHALNTIQTHQAAHYLQRTGKNEISKDIKDDIDFSMLDKINALKQDEDEAWNDLKIKRENSRASEGINNIKKRVSPIVSGVKNYFSDEHEPDNKKYPPISKDNQDFVNKMRAAYSKVLEEKGIDTKYTDGLVAQAALESSWGKSQSGKNNLGGITVSKANLDSVPHTWRKTFEYIDGKKVSMTRPFRDFDSLEDYANYHVSLLNSEFKNKYDAFSGDSLNDFVNRIVKGGYATAPNYGNILANTIKTVQRYPVENTAEEGQQEGSGEEQPSIVEPDASRVYIAENTSEPKITENGIEYRGQTYNPEFAQNIGAFDYKTGKFRWDQVGSGGALDMAQNDVPVITPDSSKPTTSGTSGGSSSGVSYTERAAKDVSGTSNSNANLELLITSTNTKLDKLTNLLAQASDQQVQATLTIAQGLGNMSVTVNNQPSSLQPTQQYTVPTYWGSNG